MQENIAEGRKATSQIVDLCVIFYQSLSFFWQILQMFLWNKTIDFSFSSTTMIKT